MAKTMQITMQQLANSHDETICLGMIQKHGMAKANTWLTQRQEERAIAERLANARELFIKHCIPRANALRFVDGMTIPCVVRSCRGDRKGRRRR